MPTTHSNIPLSRAEIGVIACPHCSEAMRLSCITAGSEGYDLVTFDCDKCERSKTFVVQQPIPKESK
jgi:hypothetical protein